MIGLLKHRSTRVALAALLLAAGLYSFLPYLTHHVTTSAFVNAELVRVTAPIGGQVTGELPSEGAYFNKPSRVSLIAAVAPDRRQLLNLEQQLASDRQLVALHESQLAEIAAFAAVLEDRVGRYRAALMQRLDQEIVHARAELAACQAEAKERSQTRARIEALENRGIAAPQQMERALSQHVAAQANCRAVETRVRTAEVERQAAEQSIFLQDGANDAPYSQQQRDRLMLRRQELEIALSTVRMRSERAAVELAEERRRLERATEYALTIPAGHVVWDLSVSAGTAVAEGQPVLDLADCNRRFISAELSARDFEAVDIGAHAMVRLVGSSDWVRGRITQVVGSAARREERLYAANVPQPGTRRIRVDIALPADVLSKGADHRCEIGRVAEVRFNRFGIDIGTSLADGLKRLVGAAAPANATL